MSVHHAGSRPKASLTAWLAAVHADQELTHTARLSRFTVHAETLDGPLGVISVRDGSITAEPVGTLPTDGQDVIVLRGSRNAWAELIDPMAAPRRHDLLALTKAADGLEIVQGRTAVIRHLRVITRLVDIGKHHARD